MGSKTKTENSFDCLQYKRQAQSEIYEQIEGMTHEEEIACFQEQAENGALGRLWKRIKASSQANAAE